MLQNRTINLFVKSYSGISKEIWLLALVTLINRAGAMVLPFLSLYFTTVEGYSLSTTGTILLFYGVGSFFGNYLGGILTDKLGPFRVQLLSLFTTGFAFFVLSTLHTPVSMAIGLFFSSLLMDIFRPANMSSVGVLVNKEKRTKAIGVLRLAINVGFVAGPATGGLIAASSGYNWLFFVDGGTCLLASVFLFYFFRKQIFLEGNKKQSQDESKPSMKLVMKDRAFLALVSLVFFIGFIFMQLFNTMPVFFKDNMFLDEDEIGLLMGINGVVVILLELPLIHIYENKNKLNLIAFGTFLIGLCYISLLFESIKSISILALVLFTVGEIFTLPFITSAIIDRAPETLRGRYLAFYGMAFSITHIVTPIVSLSIAGKFGFTNLWLFVIFISALTAIGFLKLKSVFK